MTAVADRDDVLAPVDVIGTRQLQDQHLVQRGQREEVEVVEASAARPLYWQLLAASTAAIRPAMSSGSLYGLLTMSRPLSIPRKADPV